MRLDVRTDLIDRKLVPIAVSGVLIAAGWLLDARIAMVAAAAVSGYPIARSAWFALRYRTLGIPALVSVAALGALSIGEYWEAAAVTFLFAFGSYLEARTLARTRDALRQLMDMAPRNAHVIRDGKEIDVPPEEVRAGEVVVVQPAEKIPVDGTVLGGRASVNQAPITGESMPVEKGPGDTVFGGTINELGYLEVQTERTGEDTTFARILATVEEAQGQKAPSQKLVERFARYYTPGILALSAATFAVTLDPVIALTLLVIACPGALVISTPVSIVAGIGNAARDLVAGLKERGIRRTVMLTGDNRRTAEAIARQVGIDEVRANLLPQDKVRAITELREQGNIVAMVGDGINDAPALVAADVGIAMGTSGTDVAIEAADITLMADNLSRLPYAIGLSRATLANIKQNVAFAIAVVLTLLAGVLGRKVFLASGMLVHEASVLAVILNAMRLMRYRS